MHVFVYTGSDLIEQFEKFCTGLMDGADDRSPSLSKSFEQRDHLETRWAIKTTETNKKRKFMGMTKSSESSWFSL